MPTKMLTYKNLLGETVSYPVRGKHYVQQRGYAYHPGTGPVGETCKTCRHRVQMQGSSQRWSKCELARATWTNGKATDILASAPACKFWKKISTDKGKGSHARRLTESEFWQLIARKP